MSQRKQNNDDPWYESVWQVFGFIVIGVCICYVVAWGVYLLLQ